MSRRLVMIMFALGLFAGLPFAASAEQSSSFGDYVVHYNALTTDTLQARVAQHYGIRRSPNRVLLNISVLRKLMGTTGQPVTARVQAHATNLNSQLQRIHMRQISDRGAIYYLGDLTVNNGDTLNFTVQVTPDPREPAHTIEFQQQFFTN